MAKKYQVIYADPPWPHLGRYRSRTRTRDTKHYPRMSTQAIGQLNVKDISDVNSVLFLWTTDGRLDKAIEVMKAWGFEYVTVAFVWVKLTNGKPVVIVSPWFMKSTELCLFGTKGRPHKLLGTRNTRQLIVCPRSTHSTKPEIARKRIEKMFPDTRKLEFFARKKSPGWDVYGDEVESDIVL